MFQRILAASAAAILPALALAAPAPADAGASSVVTVAAGTISSPSGAAMSGVNVSLFTWPPDAVLAALKPGQMVPRKLVGAATTSSAGRYTLDVPQASLNAAAAPSGYVNLEIDSPAAGMSFFSYQVKPQPGEPSVPVTVNLGRKTKWPCDKDSSGRPFSFTGFKFQHARAPAWAVVGQGYILKQRGTRGDSVTFEYTEGRSHSQDSALGVGLSGHGFDAGYRSFGSHESTATGAEGYAAEHRNTWFRTEFNTGQYRGECIGRAGQTVHHEHQKGCPKNDGLDPVHKCLWLVHSRGWFGGQSTQHPKAAPRTPRGNCAPHGVGDRFHSDRGTAVKWSRGFELGASLGIKGADLKSSFDSTAHTGYDDNALMSFRFHHKGFLCGTNRSEAHAAILVQRANKP
jgi:hypothetical protein